MLEDDGTVSHDATRVNSIDVEAVVSAAEKTQEKLQGESEKERQRDELLRLDKEEDPLQWSTWRKWTLSVLMGSVYFNSTMASSMAAGAITQYEREFAASPVVASLVISTYLIGFSFGPIFFSSFSEVYGRKASLLIGIPCYCLFNIGCGFSKSMTTLLVLRVFAGFFGACPQSVAGASISDVWTPRERVWPMFIYTVAAFLGPILGPLFGGFLYVSGNWEWIYFMIAIYAGVNLLLVITLQKESYVPVLHRRKAIYLRSNGHPNLYAPLEQQDESIYDIVKIHISRPLIMLFTELPLIYAAGWTGFTYSILFLFFEAYPVIFEGIYGMNAGQQGLCFLGLGVGIALSVPIVRYFANEASRNARKSGGPLIPEMRLKQVMLSAPLFVLGL